MPLSAPPLSLDQASTRRFLRAGAPFLFLAVVGILLIGFAVFLRGLERPAQWTIPADQITPMDGLAWQVTLKDRLEWPWQPRGDSLYDPFRSDLRLFEDGRALGPPHTRTERVLQHGGGAYVQWGRLLIFSTPDGSDPRTNGRQYRVEFTAGISRLHQQQAAESGTLMLLLALVGLLWLGRQRLVAQLVGAARHLRLRAGDILLAALVPVALAWFSWAQLPPTWNGSDSVIWLLWQLTWIPHHPPVYPLMMAFLHATSADEAGMLAGAVAIQQVLQVIAVVYLATALRGWWRILLVSVCASLGAALGLFGNGLFTEGMAHPLLLLFLGATLRLGRDGLTPRVATMLVLTLLLASLTRYLMIVLGGIPIAYLVLLALRERRLRAGWRLIAAASALMVGVVVLNSAINVYISLMLDAQQAPVLGRPAIYRIQDAYQLVPAAQREQWLAGLQARTDDPALRIAYPLLARIPNPWNGPRDALAAEPALYGIHPDRLMTAGFKRFALSLDHFTWAQWAQEFPEALFSNLTSNTGVGQIRYLFDESARAIETIFPLDPMAVAAVAATGTGADDTASAVGYRELARAPWVAMVDRLLPLEPGSRALLLAGSLVLLILAVWRGRDARPTSLMLALWAGILAYLLALTLITVVLPRYLAPIDILLWLSNALGIMVLAAPKQAFGAASGRP